MAKDIADMFETCIETHLWWYILFFYSCNACYFFNKNNLQEFLYTYAFIILLILKISIKVYKTKKFKFFLYILMFTIRLFLLIIK